MLFALFAAALILVGQPLSVPGTTVPHGTVATYHQHHTVSPSGLHDDRSGWTYSFPVSIRAEHPAVRHPASRPHRAAHRPPARRRAPAQRQRRGYWVQVFTTGYDDTGQTASGLMAGYGRVAVDRRVFPLGTRFWIPRYGYAVAADTGGAVIGYHIDLWFSTAAQCDANTGVRMVEVLS